MSLERQREDNDMRNQVVISAVWKPNYFESFNRLCANILDGWSIAATISMHSGKPFNITSGNDDNLDGNNNDRPNVLPGKAERVLDTHRSRLGSTVPSGLTPPHIAGLLRCSYVVPYYGTTVPFIMV